MSLELFLLLLLAVSVFTGLTTEAIKKLFDESGKKFAANTLAGIVATVLAILACAGYTILVGAAINAQLAVYLIALVFLSWLCAMVGYDKVIQAISQVKTNNSGSE